MVAFTSLIMLVFFIAVGVFVGGLLLRTSCKMLNRFAGGYREAVLENTDAIPVASQNVTAPADPNPFAAPKTDPAKSVVTPEQGVPVPGYGKACGISALACISYFLVGILISILSIRFAAIDGNASSTRMTAGFVWLISLVVPFLATLGANYAFLPTSFGKATVVSLLFFMLWLAIGIGCTILAIVVLMPFGIELTGVN